MPPFAAIADDFTGATDLALTLQREGWRTALTVGVPLPGAPLPDIDALVVALKSRTVEAREAIDWSLASAKALRAASYQQLFFKYCSTFDSTDAGNIGPVTDALMGALDIDFTIACPAFPANGRTVYSGHLFVGNLPLSESPMKDHPLTPMRDANLVRVLQRQTPRKVGLIPYAAVDGGIAALKAAFAAARRDGIEIAIVDAVTERHLRDIGHACDDMALVTGGSGVSMGLPSATGARRPTAPPPFPVHGGGEAILAGSCSQATRNQVAREIAGGTTSYRLDPAALPDRAALSGWIRAQRSDARLLIYSTADPADVRAAQAANDGVSARIEKVLAHAAADCVVFGRTRIVVAGGETSGAVVEQLGIRNLEVGPEIAPGVPWTRDLAHPALVLALKSGNFGGPDFFSEAFERIR